MENLLRKGEQGGLPAGADSIVRSSISQQLGSEPFRHFIQNTQSEDLQHWMVAAINQQRIKNLGLPEEARIVRLSSESVVSHRKRFEGFSGEDWQRVQRIADKGEWLKQGDTHRALWLDDDGKPWLAVIKRSREGELFLVSYRRASEGELKKLRSAAERGQ